MRLAGRLHQMQIMQSSSLTFNTHRRHRSSSSKTVQNIDNLAVSVTCYYAVTLFSV